MSRKICLTTISSPALVFVAVEPLRKELIAILIDRKNN